MRGNSIVIADGSVVLFQGQTHWSSYLHQYVFDVDVTTNTFFPFFLFSLI